MKGERCTLWMHVILITSRRYKQKESPMMTTKVRVSAGNKDDEGL